MVSSFDCCFLTVDLVFFLYIVLVCVVTKKIRREIERSKIKKIRILVVSLGREF